MDDNSIPYNLLLVGSKGVGKFSLHNQFVHNLFPSVYDPFFDDPAESNIRECFWKHAEGRKSTIFRVRPQRDEISKHGDYEEFPGYHNVNGMVLVYRITSMSSFQAIEQWVAARKAAYGGTLYPKPLVLVGNMSDCKRKERRILGLEAEELASKIGCAYVECSAKDGRGIEKVKAAALKQMVTQKDELISIELGLISRKRLPQPRVIQGSDRTARETFERRNSFVGKLASLRSTRRKTSDASLRSKITVTTVISQTARKSEDSARLSESELVCSMSGAWPNAPGSAAAWPSYEDSESTPSPASFQSEFSDSTRYSAFSSSSSGRSQVSSDDMSLYPVGEEDEDQSRPTSPESDDATSEREKKLPTVPILSPIQRQMVLAGSPVVESLDEILECGVPPRPSMEIQHKRIDSMEPEGTSGRAAASEDVNGQPLMDYNVSESDATSSRQAPNTPSEPAVNPILFAPVDVPPPAVPMRSPRRTLCRRSTAITDIVPAPLAPSLTRQCSRRSEASTRSEVFLNRVELPALSPEEAAVARQNILMQLATLMQIQPTQVPSLVHPAQRQEKMAQQVTEMEAEFSNTSSPVDVEALEDKLDGEIETLRERLQKAEERKKRIEGLKSMSTGTEKFGKEQAGLWGNTGIQLTV